MEDTVTFVREINNALNCGPKRYINRKFNRFNVEKSLWWMVPSTEWPAYQYGKYAIEPKSNGYLVGLHIEKGREYKKEIVALLKSSEKKEAMNDSWAWHNWKTAIKEREIEKRLDAIVKSMPNCPNIFVLVYNPDQNEHLELKLKNKQLMDVNNAVYTWDDIILWIDNTDNIEEVWIDFYLYFALPSNQLNQWDSNEIVEKLLLPFEKWIK